MIIAERIGTEEGFNDFSTGACGRGLYTSCSAVDLIDRGDEVIHLHLMTESKLLMIDPEVFGVGFSELFEMALHRLSYHWVPPDSEQNRRLAKAFAAPELIDPLLDAGEFDGCLFSYGLNPAVMLRTSNRTWRDGEEDCVALVKTYAERHPGDIPMLAPGKLRQWLAARGG